MVIIDKVHQVKWTPTIFILSIGLRWCPTFYFPKNNTTKPNINAKLQDDDLHVVSLKLSYDIDAFALVYKQGKVIEDGNMKSMHLWARPLVLEHIDQPRHVTIKPPCIF